MPERCAFFTFAPAAAARHIGPGRWARLKRMEADKLPYRFAVYDWKRRERF